MRTPASASHSRPTLLGSASYPKSGLASDCVIPQSRPVPISYEIDAERRLVVTTVQGEVTAEDLRLHTEAMTADPRRRELLDEIVDLSRARGSSIATRVIRDFAQVMREKDRNTPGTKLAFVASGNAAFGLARMFEAYRAHPSFEIQVFRDAAGALRWLGRE